MDTKNIILDYITYLIMKTLLIAEKPSVAKNFVEFLSKHQQEHFSKKDGYYESTNYYVSWFFGHLVALSSPEKYGWTEWTLTTLPMIPDTWKYEVMDNSGAKKQFKTIKSLFSKTNDVINGTDPDREGELIFRLVTHLLSKTNIPTRRLWANDFTYEGLVKSWDSIKPASHYDSLYAAANCRQRADWLIGMNMSRIYSIITKTKGLSVGRVQTPTLAMIVSRDLEIQNWTKSFYSLLSLKTEIKNKIYDFVYVGTDKTSKAQTYVTEAEINELNDLKDSLSLEQLKLNDVATDSKTTAAPLMFSLSDLQKEANKLFGYSADLTLSTTQKLYENKFVTYPRTDCNYLPDDSYTDSYQLLQEFIDQEQLQFILTTPPKTFNTSKVTAHTAITPTNHLPTSLNKEESNIYDLIKTRFILSFGVSKKTTSFNLYISNKQATHYFYKQINVVNDYGFENLFNETRLEQFSIDVNESIKFISFEQTEKERTKPSYYNEATLLTAMENCSKLIDDKELKVVLKDNEGIGQPSTRANIIQTLKKRDYILLKGKNLISTDKGRSLIKLVSPEVSSPIMTASWESQLSKIESREMNWKVFYDSITDFTKETTLKITKLDLDLIVSDDSLSFQKQSVYYQCPSCKNKTVVINKFGAFCENKEICEFKLFRKQFKKSITDKNIIELLTKKKTSAITFKSKANKPYKASLVLVNNETKLSFD